MFEDHDSEGLSPNNGGPFVSEWPWPTKGSFACPGPPIPASTTWFPCLLMFALLMIG